MLSSVNPPKVILRAMEPEDLDLLYQIENDTDLWDIGCTNVPYSRFVLREYIARATDDIFADKQVRLIVENGQGETVGIVDLVNYDPKHARAEVGIVIRKAFRGRGYGRQALLQLLDYGRRVVHLHQVFAFVGENNKVCHHMLQEVGFQESMTLKDWLQGSKGFEPAYLMQYFF